MATYIILGVGGWMTTVEAPSGQNNPPNPVGPELQAAVDERMNQFDWGCMDEEDTMWLPEQVDEKDQLKQMIVAYKEEGYSLLGEYLPYPTTTPPQETQTGPTP